MNISRFGILFTLALLLTPGSADARGGGYYTHNSSHSSSSYHAPRTYRTPSSAPVHVRGYTKKDGTYVAPHYRSHPDKSYNNNWSVKGNVNPYTGKAGTKTPKADDRPPPKSPPG